MDAITAVLVAIIGGLAGAGGAILGARVAARESQAARDDARRTRFHDDLRQVATALAQAAEQHRKEREQQWARWNEVSDAGLDPATNPIPEVDTTEPIFDAAVALDLIAAKATSDAAWKLYGASTRLDAPGFTYDAKRHLRGSAVERPSEADRESFPLTLKSYHRRVWEFTNAVRDELGIELLAEPDLSVIPTK